MSVFIRKKRSPTKKDHVKLKGKEEKEISGVTKKGRGLRGRRFHSRKREGLRRKKRPCARLTCIRRKGSSSWEGTRICALKDKVDALETRKGKVAGGGKKKGYRQRGGGGGVT